MRSALGRKRVRKNGVMMAVAAAAVLVVLGGALWLVLSGRMAPSETSQPAGAAPVAATSNSTAASPSPAPAEAKDAGAPRASVTAGPRGIVDLVAPKGAVIEPVTGPDGVPVVRLSGVSPESPSGGRPGIFLPLAPAFERVASGNTVRVTVTARSAADDPSPAFAVAYSTAEVGNSGWQPFKLTDQLTPYSFTYAVPPMKRGQGDYVGILAHPAGAQGAVEVSAISVEVLPPGAAGAAP